MIRLLLATLLAFQPAFAQTSSNVLTIGPKTNVDKKVIFNRNASNKPNIRWNETTGSLQFSNDGTNYTDIGSGTGSGGGYNLLTSNPEFESGISQGWTNSGGSWAAASSGSNLLYGKGSGVFNSSTGSQYVRSDAYTLPAGLTDSGRTCMVRMYYKGGDANYTLRALDGSNTIITGSSVTLAAASSTTSIFQTFPCPTSGSMKLEVVSTGDGAELAIDRMYLGEMDLLQQVSQASFYGSAAWVATASCSWTLTSTSFTSYSADSDCTTPGGSSLKGNAVAPSTKIPAIRFQNLPPGKYFLVATGYFTQNSNTNQSVWRFYDGSTASTEETPVYSSGTAVVTGTVMGTLEYTTTQSDITIQIQGKGSGSNATEIINTAQPLVINVFRYPTSTDTVFRPDQVANSWSGYHDSTCSWSVASATVQDPSADSTCGFSERVNNNFGTVTSRLSGSDKLPGIVFTPSRPGTYYVCATIGAYNSSSSAEFKARFWDGTTAIDGQDWTSGSASTIKVPIPLCGLYKATSTSSVTLSVQIAASTGTASISAANPTSAAIAWTIYQIDQKLPAPILVGGVTSDSTGGIEKICRATIAEGAACSSSPCTITRQSGCLSSVTRSGTGQYTANFVGSAFSAAPSCVILPGTGANEAQVPSAITTSALALGFSNNGSSADAQNFQIICVGPK